MMTEEQIKAVLDGTFTTWDVAREKWFEMPVSHDYVPTHKPMQCTKNRKGEATRAAGGFYPWTHEEDETVIAMRTAGNTFYAIAEALGLAPKTVRNRYYKLCAQRGIEPVSMEVSYPRMITREQERRIAQMRRDGMGFRDIGEALGLTRIQANHAHIRWKKREGKKRAAA